jgi:NAD(P)-dependent dehydrogenase (short-subunit alcohol dehydrogenase family)
MRPLQGQVAVVAGATRGAGRGIACMLGEAGATVYCTGRSVRGNPNRTGYFAGRPESIDETAEMVSARGGAGISVRVDHLVEEEVATLFERVRREQGRLDVLVNDISEGDLHEWKPFWQLSLDRAFAMFRNGVHTHILTSRYAAPLMIENRRGLIVEIGDGDSLGYRGTLFYDLVKVTVSRLAYVMAEDLHRHGVAALALTPGFMRTETILEHFGVTRRTGATAPKRIRASSTPRRPSSSAAPSPPSPRIRTCSRSPAASTARGNWRASSASRTSTARSRTRASTSASSRQGHRAPVSDGRWNACLRLLADDGPDRVAAEPGWHRRIMTS